jgi:hypothetical protein
MWSQLLTILVNLKKKYICGQVNCEYGHLLTSLISTMTVSVTYFTRKSFKNTFEYVWSGELCMGTFLLHPSKPCGHSYLLLYLYIHACTYILVQWSQCVHSSVGCWCVWNALSHPTSDPNPPGISSARPRCELGEVAGLWPVKPLITATLHTQLYCVAGYLSCSSIHPTL